MAGMAKLILRLVLGFIALAALGAFLFIVLAPPYFDNRMNPVAEHEPYVISDDAQALHATIPVADLHADSLLWNRDLLKRNDRGHVDIPRMREGGMFLQVFTAVTKSPKGQNYEENDTDAPDNISTLVRVQRWPRRTWDSRVERALYQAEKLHRFAEDDDAFLVVTNRASLEAALATWQGQAAAARSLSQLELPAAEDLSVIDLSAVEETQAEAHAVPIAVGILGTEGSHALDGDLANMDRLFDAGYRMMGLQHFFDNRLGGSLHGTSGKGLTLFGREAVARMRDLGIVIDVAHSSEQVVRDTLAMGAGPLIVSHTGFNGHCESPRNISDALMAEIAANGGLIGVGFWEDVTCDASPAGIADAILYGVENFGVDHIALGSDFDGTVATALDASEMAAITQALMDRGMPDDDIRRVMGGNTVRFFLANLPE